MPFDAMKAAPLAAALALSTLACGQTIHSQVSTFNQLSERQHDATYAIMPLREQRGSREFAGYQRRVRAHLEANGFVPESLDRAEFVVAMAYANDDGSDVLASYPIIGQTGSSSSRMAGTLQAYRNTTSYSATTERAPPRAAESDDDESGAPRVLRLDIVRRDSIGFGDIEKVYEGEVVSTGSDEALAEIVPAMIEALFQEFPGKDGEVRQVASKSVPSLEEIGAPPNDCRTGADCAHDKAGRSAPHRESARR
jgi:hypothetical protein